jgi:S-DNA-T family DNA segregation ATPase FtsK/SpoIIIE
MSRDTATRRDFGDLAADPGREIEPYDTRTDAALVASRHQPADVYSEVDAGRHTIYPTRIYQGQDEPRQRVQDRAVDLLDRSGGGERTLRPFQYLTDIHAWPAIGSIGFAAMGVGVHSEPWHPWIAGAMIPLGFAGLGFSGAAHLMAIKNNSEADPIMTRGAALVGIGLIAGGTACATGISWITGMLAAAALGISYTGWHLWRHHKLQRQREFVIDQTAAENSGAAPIAGPLPPSLPPGPRQVSFEAMRLHEAFEDLKVTPIVIKSLRESGEDTHTAVIALPAGSNITPSWIIGKRAEIANNLRCQHLEITRTGAKDEVQITWFDGDDKLADTILWPGTTNTSFEQPIALGLFENLAIVTETFLWNHALVAGATDNGKSGVINVILCSTLPCIDVVRIGIDCKPGAPELGPYRRVMYKLATNAEEGMRVLRGIKAAIKVRGEFIGLESEIGEDNEDGVPVRKWDPKYGPYLLVPIDELAELTREFPEAGKILESIRQIGRYVGVHCLDATQYPSKGVFGGKTDPRQQYQIRIGMSCPEPTSINVIFGAGAQGNGWRLEELKHKGSFMIKSRAHKQPRDARAYYITDETIARMVNEWDGKVPDLDKLSADAFDEAYNAEPEQPKKPGGPGRGRSRNDDYDDGFDDVSGLFDDRPVRTLHDVSQLRYPRRPGQRFGEPVEQHLIVMWETFAASAAGRTVDDLVDLKQPRLTSRDSIRKVLRAWVGAGYAWKSESGTYYPVPETADEMAR